MATKHYELIVRVSEELLARLVAGFDGEGSEEDAVAAEVTRTGIVVEQIDQAYIGHPEASRG